MLVGDKVRLPTGQEATLLINVADIHGHVVVISEPGVYHIVTLENLHRATL